jgi:hypothetical protein
MVTDILEFPFACVLYSEDIGSRFLCNIDDRHKNTQCYKPEDGYVNLQCSKNLRFFIEFVLLQASIVTSMLKTLNIITTVVPPAMTAGTISSQNRLKKLGI